MVFSSSFFRLGIHQQRHFHRVVGEEHITRPLEVHLAEQAVGDAGHSQRIHRLPRDILRDIGDGVRLAAENVRRRLGIVPQGLLHQAHGRPLHILQLFRVPPEVRQTHAAITLAAETRRRAVSAYFFSNSSPT